MGGGKAKGRSKGVGTGELVADLGLHSPKPDEEPAATTPQPCPIAE